MIGVLITLAAATSPTKPDKTKKVTTTTTVKPAVSDAKTNSTKPAKTSSSSASSGRTSKVLKFPKSAENRGKRTLYDFNNAAYLYPQIAARRAGYNPESRSAYSTQSGFFNGQNAIGTTNLLRNYSINSYSY